MNLKGTLESTGLNSGTNMTPHPCTYPGFNSMSINADTSPPQKAQVESAGLNTGALGVTAAPLSNQVIPTNDTQSLDVPEGGTLGSGGLNE